MSQAAVAPMLTLTEYSKTAKGKALIASQRRFAFEGRIWQGYRGAAYEVRPHQLSGHELDGIFDIDGSKRYIIEHHTNKVEQRKKKVRIEHATRKAQRLEIRNRVLGTLAQQRKDGLVDPELEAVAKDLELIDGEGNRVSKSTTPPDPRFLRSAPVDPLVKIEMGEHPFDHAHKGGDLTEDMFKITGDEAQAPQQVSESPELNLKVVELEGRMSGIESTLDQIVGLLTSNQVPVQDVVEPGGEIPDHDVSTPVGPVHATAAPPASASSEFDCADCGKPCPADHTNPPMWLRGHRMSKHSKPKG